MPTSIDTQELQRLCERGAQLVEVLPAREFDEQHLPGAVNIPVKEINAERVRDLDPGRPVVVYCFDFQ